MDSANVLDIFTCGICLETFDESSKCPRILFCGHSFCHSCLGKLLALSPCCPTCKAEILFQTTETIPINFSLKSLINIRSQILVPNSSTNLEGETSESHKGGAAKSERKTSSRKFLTEGYCNEHEYFQELRCMNCNTWICGLCSSLQHQHCRTLLVEEAYKELKKQVSQSVEEELGQRTTRTQKFTESLREMEEEKKSLIEVIKSKELELKDWEKRIQELESLKAEENKFCDRLKQLQTMVENSANDAEFSKNLVELEKLQEEGKNQIPVDLPPRLLPHTREALGTLCLSRSVYAVENRYDGTRYGKVALKYGQILVSSFQQEKPEDATLFAVTPVQRRHDTFEVIIKTDGLTPRAKNCILLCSALKGTSYKRKALNGNCRYSSYQILSAPFHVVEGIRDDDPKTPLQEGAVYEVFENCPTPLFLIQLKDDPSYSRPKIGVVIVGLQQLKDLRGMRCSIEECGLVI